MRVLVTGSDGYIGSLLGPLPVERGHEVVGVDTGFYTDAWLYNATAVAAVETLQKDIRLLTAEDFEGVDAVVHMAELSNDPLAQLAPEVTYEINHRGSLHVAATAKAAGVERFVYTSSCSVYGAAARGPRRRGVATRARRRRTPNASELVERDVSAMADDEFSPTFLRNATAYGASPRMRFDIVLNNLCRPRLDDREIRMESDGTPLAPACPHARHLQGREPACSRRRASVSTSRS